MVRSALGVSCKVKGGRLSLNVCPSRLLHVAFLVKFLVQRVLPLLSDRARFLMAETGQLENVSCYSLPCVAGRPVCVCEPVCVSDAMVSSIMFLFRSLTSVCRI